jgi:hypothetical protein
MSEPKSIVDAQLEALLRLVAQHFEDRCRQTMAQAKAQAAALTEQAHREARDRMHEAIQHERARWDEKIQWTRAHLWTRQCQRRQRVNMLLLQQGWEKLYEILVQRWQKPNQRRLWVDALIDQALTRLPGKTWRIEHPPDWPADERLHASERLAAHIGGQSPSFVEVQDIVAGLRIRADETCLDGTVAGLLANRKAIEGQLLAEIGRASISEVSAVDPQTNPYGALKSTTAARCKQ